MISNLFIDDLTSATPAELSAAIVRLARSGVEEKFRLDFKSIWQPEKQVPDIVALANSSARVKHFETPSMGIY